MDICHEHNLIGDPPSVERRYGISVRLLPTDPFRRFVGDDWEKQHWFASRRERDEAIDDMRKRHRYSRIGDEPSLSFEPIER